MNDQGSGFRVYGLGLMKTPGLVEVQRPLAHRVELRSRVFEFNLTRLGVWCQTLIIGTLKGVGRRVGDCTSLNRPY